MIDREYEPWTRGRVLVDSCRLEVQEAVDQLVSDIALRRRTPDRARLA